MYEIKTKNGSVCETGVSFVAATDNDSAFFDFDVVFPEWEEDTYVFLPACAYNGNKMEPMEATLNCRSYSYDMAEGDFKHRISHNVPALRKDGSGSIEVTTGDTAVPCVGIFYPEKKKGFLIFTEQEVKGRNIGLTVRSGIVTVSYPSNRSYIYRNFNTRLEEKEKGIAVKAGEVISSELKIITFDCKDIPNFYSVFFKNRKCLLDGRGARGTYTRERWEATEKHFNSLKWSGEYYGEGSSNLNLRWSSGFIGAVQNAYALYVVGNDETKARAIKTVDYLVAHQGESGFFIPCVYANGKYGSDWRSIEGKPNTVFVSRKAGEMLIAIFKALEVMPLKAEWENAARKCADALVLLFKKHGNFCHYIDWQDGTALITGSSAGAIGVAGLVKAWEYFKSSEYLETAKEAMEFYYHTYLEKGTTEGCPTDILSAPNSEASYAMVESTVALYEATGEERYLAYARTAVEQFSSWVMSYRYKFPEASEYGRLNLNTVGSVFASVQNKHSSPGICTFSGDAIYKLYKMTGNKDYLELILDIAAFIPQTISTDDRPIFTGAWDNPPKQQMSGAICERVNTSDWEGDERIGGIFYASCWCASAYVMTVADLMDKEEFSN